MTENESTYTQIPEAEYLTVSAVAEWLYCPRSFWYEVHNGRRKARNEHVEAGFLEDQARIDRHLRKAPDKSIHKAVHLVSPRLGLRGQVDAVWEQAGSLLPVEYRHGQSPGTETDRAVILLLAIMLEESSGQEIPKARLFFLKDRQHVDLEVNTEARHWALDAVHKARAEIKRASIPENPLKPQCQGCSWYPQCCPDMTAKGVSETVKVLPRRRFDRVLYVDEPQAKVRQRASTLVVTKEKKTLMSIGMETIDQLALVGRSTHITTPALRKILDHGIEVVLLTRFGRYQGRLVSERFRNPALQRAQHRRSSDPAFCLETSRAIVSAKIHNQCIQIQRLARRSKDSDTLTKLRKHMRTRQSQALLADSLDSLRGHEGLASRHYFQALRNVVEESGLDFPKRQRRPPRDPFNALLSFCYAMLTKDVEAAISVVGLNPCLGLFHSEVYGRPALALDLMEEFRPVIADAVALRLIRQKILKPTHFEESFAGVFLNAGGRKKLYQAWEHRMNEELAHPSLKTKFSLRRTLEVQARLLSKVFEGSLPAYQALKIR